MYDQKVELLAPAGNAECLDAAIAAGADAVYLAGQRFGARASADNFTSEGLIEAIDKAHLYGVRVYLTLNTLIKEKEWADIFDMLYPLYLEGLDGIIIQDLGLIPYLKAVFPRLSLHASTQMTVTHSQSVRFLTEKGIERVVAARELSLDEIKAIKDDTGVDLEVFVHGAMCYSYSGACLFSSFLGGRSGNRGRCAGPCRLPYNGSDHPLSLRDMCYIDHIGELIKAGVNSFKIEGRLKSPEYVATVTGIYRKYIDRYYDGEDIKVSDEDRDTLSALYLRGGESGGYLFSHNSASMITLNSPSYESAATTDTAKTADRAGFGDRMCRKAHCYACFHVKQPMKIGIYDDSGVSIEVTGDVVEAASNRAAEYDDTISRIGKTGGTGIELDRIELDLSDGCFLPVGKLNALRRDAVDAYIQAVCDGYRRSKDDVCDENSACHGSKDRKPSSVNTGRKGEQRIAVAVKSADHLNALKGYRINRLYIPYDLIYSGEVTDELLQSASEDIVEEGIYLKLPRIHRKRSDGYMDTCLEYISAHEEIEGVLVSNLEQLNILKRYNEQGVRDIKLICDHSLYVWNRHSSSFLSDECDLMTAPLELSLEEIKDTGYVSGMEYVIYARACLMVSAGCVKKTYGRCEAKSRPSFTYITDRYGKKEPVYTNCIHCYNEIYNALPTSAHKRMGKILDMGFASLRIELTDEDKDTVHDIMSRCLNYVPDEYTAGHIDKGAL